MQNLNLFGERYPQTDGSHDNLKKNKRLETQGHGQPHENLTTAFKSRQSWH